LVTTQLEHHSCYPAELASDCVTQYILGALSDIELRQNDEERYVPDITCDRLRASVSIFPTNASIIDYFHDNNSIHYPNYLFQKTNYNI